MSIKSIGVIGCGTMGSGIAQVCAQFGYTVKALTEPRSKTMPAMAGYIRILLPQICAVSYLIYDLKTSYFE